MDLLELLKGQNVNEDSIYGYDPVVNQQEIEALGIHYSNLKNGFKNADVVIIMNNHHSYQKMDIFSLLDSTKENLIFFDGWHIFEPKAIIGIKNNKYLGVGCKF